MAKAFNIIILMCCIGFVYFMFFQINPVVFGGKEKFFANLTQTNGTIDQFYANLPFSPGTGLTALAAGALVVLTVVFPNPYTLYAIPAAALLTIYNATSDLTSGMGLPAELLTIFQILGFAFLLYLVGWHKGNE